MFLWLEQEQRDEIVENIFHGFRNFSLLNFN